MRSFSALHSQPYTVRGMTLWSTNSQEVINQLPTTIVMIAWGTKKLWRVNCTVHLRLRTGYCDYKERHLHGQTKKG